MLPKAEVTTETLVFHQQRLQLHSPNRSQRLDYAITRNT